MTIITNEYFKTINCGNLPILVITAGTQDFPDSYVVRLHIYDTKTHTSSPTRIFQKANSLNEVRQAIPAQCTKLERRAEDDPVIVESWL